MYQEPPEYIQHAIRKDRSKDEKETKIICIKTSSARTSEGKEVRWRHIPIVKQELKMGKLSAQFTFDELDYSDVWVTTDSIVPGDGSFWVSLDTLKKEERDFGATVDLTHNEISLAAQLGRSFEPVKGARKSSVPSHLLSAFLALNNQSASGSSLRSWLEKVCVSYPWVVGDVDAIPKSGICELDQSRRIDKVVGQRGISRILIGLLGVYIPDEQVFRKRKAYKKRRKETNARVKKEREKEKDRQLKRKGGKEEETSECPGVKLAKVDMTPFGYEVV